MAFPELDPEQRREIHEEEPIVPDSKLQNSDVAPELADKMKEGSLVEYIDGNHLRVEPIMEGNEVKEYAIKTKKGNQLFRIDRGDMMLNALKDTILQVNADHAETTGTYDMVEAAQRSLRRLGMPEDQIPKDSHAIARDILKLAEDFRDIQTVRTEIETQNTLQSLLRVAQTVFEGGKGSWANLDPYTKRMLMLLSDPLAMVALQKLGVNEKTVDVSKNVRDIGVHLTELKREASVWAGLGKALQGLGVGSVEFLIGDPTKGNGILSGAGKLLGTGISSAIDKTGEVAARATDGLRTRIQEDRAAADERKRKKNEDAQ